MTLFWGISAWKSPVWYDDAGHYLVVRALADQGQACYPVSVDDCRPGSPFITMGPALNYPLAGWLRLTGGGMGSARTLMVALGLMAFMAFGLLARALLSSHGKTWWALALLLGNIQWITYGAEVLGEVPMLGWAMLGFWAHLRWLDGRKWPWAVLAVAAWSLSILCKEYMLVVLGMGLILWLLALLVRKEWGNALGVVLQGAVVLGAWLLYHLAQAGGIAEVQHWFEERQSYGSEFLAFDFAESLRFLAFKPLIALGTAALAVKVYVKRSLPDVFMLCLQAAWLLFFLSSAGFDRFGFQLALVPAIYLSEFILLAWRRWVAGKWRRAALFAVVFGALFWQRSLVMLPERIFGGEEANALEKETAAAVAGLPFKAIFTYDQQIVPFLPAHMRVRLSPDVPSNAEACTPLQLQSGELFIAGLYAYTEYGACVPWEKLEKMQRFGGGDAYYELWRVPASLLGQ